MEKTNRRTVNEMVEEQSRYTLSFETTVENAQEVARLLYGLDIEHDLYNHSARLPERIEKDANVTTISEKRKKRLMNYYYHFPTDWRTTKQVHSSLSRRSGVVGKRFTFYEDLKLLVALGRVELNEHRSSSNEYLWRKRIVYS